MVDSLHSLTLIQSSRLFACILRHNWCILSCIHHTSANQILITGNCKEPTPLLSSLLFGCRSTEPKPMSCTEHRLVQTDQSAMHLEISSYCMKAPDYLYRLILIDHLTSSRFKWQQWYLIAFLPLRHTTESIAICTELSQTLFFCLNNLRPNNYMLGHILLLIIIRWIHNSFSSIWPSN